jgi:hypothetical protein
MAPDLASHVLPPLVNPHVTPVASRDATKLYYVIESDVTNNDGHTVRAFHCTCPVPITKCWHVRQVRNQEN